MVKITKDIKKHAINLINLSLGMEYLLDELSAKKKAIELQEKEIAGCRAALVEDPSFGQMIVRMSGGKHYIVYADGTWERAYIVSEISEAEIDNDSLE